MSDLSELQSPPYRVAVIDLGSNTARVILMNTVPGYSFRLEDEIREVVRLRQGMTADGLSPEAVERALFTLRLFSRFSRSVGADVILATATSAVRDAANGPACVDRVREEIGLELRILDGEREAYYGTIGALNEVAIGACVVLDIGGGSAQLSEVRDRRYRRGVSLTLGALALSERFVNSDPATKREIKALREEIEVQLDSVAWVGELAGVELVGLGGTIRNLAKIDAAARGYPLNTLHGYRLSRDAVDQSIANFRKLSLVERQKIPGISSDRADVILAGALVLAAVFRRLDIGELTISTSGLREGIFFEHFLRDLPEPVMPDVRSFGVLNMARNYRYHEQHANQVKFLAGRLFEELAPLHGYGPPERELLEAAALLHDLGTVIAYDGHHRHSQTLIHYNGLAGFTPRDIALIALLARFHRKGRPDPAGYEDLLKKRDTAVLTRLAAILRLAEFLERGRNAIVSDVLIDWDDEELRITVVATEHPAVAKIQGMGEILLSGKVDCVRDLPNPFKDVTLDPVDQISLRCRHDMRVSVSR